MQASNAEVYIRMLPNNLNLASVTEPEFIVESIMLSSMHKAELQLCSKRIFNFFRPDMDVGSRLVCYMSLHLQLRAPPPPPPPPATLSQFNPLKMLLLFPLHSRTVLLKTALEYITKHASCGNVSSSAGTCHDHPAVPVQVGCYAHTVRRPDEPCKCMLWQAVTGIETGYGSRGAATRAT
eukprot:SAG31_NODE_4420_length_3250_cov_1.490003_2_plen_180_part_00